LARTSALIFTACRACRGMLDLRDLIAIVNARHLSREPVSGVNWLMLNTIVTYIVFSWRLSDSPRV
jgi:hypothetical protein